MPLVHLQNATLECESPVDEDSSALSGFLDQIKLSASSSLGLQQPASRPEQVHRDVRHGDRKALTTSLSFAAITESLSASSEDISEALGRTFGMFKAESVVSRTHEPPPRPEQYLHHHRLHGPPSPFANVMAPPPPPPPLPHLMSVKSQEAPLVEQCGRFVSQRDPAQRTLDILDEVTTGSYDEWDDEVTMEGSREVSLLDQEDSDEETFQEGESLLFLEQNMGGDEEGDSFDSEDDDDDDSFRSFDTNPVDRVEQGIARFASMLYRMGTCTLRRDDYDEEYT